ncbi:DUF6461 domain-containing protein [Streptomyces sp. NPDC054796]
MTTSPTAHDYTWFRERFPDLAEAYCVTLVEGLSPREALLRLGVNSEIRVLWGVRALCEAAFGDWELWDGVRAFVSAAAVGNWALVIEPNGFLAAVEQGQEKLSRGTRQITCFKGVSGNEHFSWVEDGEALLEFDLLTPGERFGREADKAAGQMRAAGFDLRDVEEPDDALYEEAAFALAERLTGVPLDADLLDGTSYLCGMAPELP